MAKPKQLYNPFEHTSNRDTWESEFPQDKAQAHIHHTLTLRALEGGHSAASGLNSRSPSPIIGIAISPSAEQQKPAAPRQLIPDPITPTVFKSVWSPDTPSTASSLDPRSSSIYSQATTITNHYNQATAPPVPQLPQIYTKGKGRIPSLVEESNSPFTLFSEDDDYEVSPVTAEKRSSEIRKRPLSDDAWWEEEAGLRVPSLATRRAQDQLHVQAAPILRVPTPRRTGSPASSVTASLDAVTPRVEKEEEVWEQPPPYSPGNYKLPMGGSMAKSAPDGESMPKLAPRPVDRKLTKARAAALAVGMATQTGLPSPGPISPAFAQSVNSPNDVGMSNIPLTPNHPHNLPDRSFGTFIPAVHAVPTKKPSERLRRRHEKEDYLAHRIGNAWRGRGPFPQTSYFGEPGEKGRKRRRKCCCLAFVVLALLILATGLAVGLVMRGRSGSADPVVIGTPPPVDTDTPHSPKESGRPTPTTTTTNIFVTATGFPPIPTGVVTVAGPINAINDSSCVDPSPLWSCSLPPEDHESVDPLAANRPTFVMQIQWDRSERWKKQIQKREGGDIYFVPEPAPPSLEDLVLMGNSTDNVQGELLEGEPTPFYISMLDSPDGSVGPNARLRRGSGGDDDGLPVMDNPPTSTIPENLPTATSSASSDDDDNDDGLPTSTIPPPKLNDDGTGAPAVLFPLARHQPLRLYDRGLPTEHYAFYTYFERTIYVRSVTGLAGSSDKPIALDLDGGSRQADAKYLVTWGSVRYHVQLYTTLPDDALVSNRTLLKGEDAGTINHSDALTVPGTMPLAVRVSLDLKGNEDGNHFVWHHDVKKGVISTRNPGIVGAGDGCGCTWTNYRDGEVERWLRRGNRDQTVNIPME